jgi:hypothetical protein
MPFIGDGQENEPIARRIQRLAVSLHQVNQVNIHRAFKHKAELGRSCGTFRAERDLWFFR